MYSQNLMTLIENKLNYGIEHSSTPLISLEKLAKELQIGKLLVKDESKNQFGTYKDRRSKYIVKFAREKSYDRIVLITAGNAGYSILKNCESTSINLYNVVDKNTSQQIKNSLRTVKSHVLEVNLGQSILSSTDLMDLVDRNDHQGILDASNGFHEAYESIFYELIHEEPDYIVVPFGSGEAFLGIVNAVHKMKSEVKVIGVGVVNRTQSYAQKLCAIWTPYETMIQSAIDRGHLLIRLKEEEIQWAYKNASKYMVCEPSSSIVFGIFHRIQFGKCSKVILVNSGRGL